jgi:hypothetical protein
MGKGAYSWELYIHKLCAMEVYIHKVCADKYLFSAHIFVFCCTRY